MGRAFQTEGEAVGKIIRAKQTSCQLSTYFVGRTAFYRLRQAIQRELGDRFDLARYHEAVLAHGTLPVKYLPELGAEIAGDRGPRARPGDDPRADPTRVATQGTCPRADCLGTWSRSGSLARWDHRAGGRESAPAIRHG